ncbi:kinase-like domain-containing protein [Xylaria venustula]|nr:kinase-like domain-containing protein [Xylaria venustula]
MRVTIPQLCLLSALFSLIPLNIPAIEVIDEVSNQHLFNETTQGLDIGHTFSKSGDNQTLAILGRSGDVVIRGRRIAKIQASFEIDSETSIVMFYDRSHSYTSRISGQNATPFEHGRPRKVVVLPGHNTMIGMGGITLEIAKGRLDSSLQMNPVFDRTIEDDGDTVVPSQREARIHTPWPQQPIVRYAKINPLGSDQFGEVYRAVNMHTGKILAVKSLKRSVHTSEDAKRYKVMKREVEIFTRLSHTHIVDCIGAQIQDSGEVKILMGLKEGTLQSFVEGGNPMDQHKLGRTVLNHMLQALDYLAKQGLVHRDVKPANILYVSRPDGLHFQLGDFGLSNHEVNAQTFAGTVVYMAPEMWTRKKTHKADVWSLYVTILWAEDVQGFRARSEQFKIPDDARNVIQTIASSTLHYFSTIRHMVNNDPEERPSAAQLLTKYFGGKGISTEADQISSNVPDTIVLAERSPTELNIGRPQTTNRDTARRSHRIQKLRLPAIQAVRAS